MNENVNQKSGRFPAMCSLRLTTKEAQNLRLRERLNSLQFNPLFPEPPHRILLRLVELGLRQVESQTAVSPVAVASLVDPGQTEMPLCRVCGGGGDLVVAGGISICPSCFQRLGAKAA